MNSFIDSSLTKDEAKSLLDLNPKTSGMIYIQSDPQNKNSFLPNKKIRVFQNITWSNLNLIEQSVIFVKAEENGLIPFNQKDEVYPKILEAIKNGTSVVLLVSNFGFFVVYFEKERYITEVQDNLGDKEFDNIILSAFNEVAQAIGQNIENQELANEMIELVGLNSLQEIFTSLGGVKVSFVSNAEDLVKILKNVKQVYYPKGDQKLISGTQ